MRELILVLIGLACIVALIEIFERKRKAHRSKLLQPEAQCVLRFDGQGVSATYGNGEVRSVDWHELTMVGITTTDEGPFAPDVFWGLHGPSGEAKLVYPGGATGDGELLEELQRRLPTFDNRQLIEAMGSTSNAHFLIWKKEGFAPPAA